MLTLRSLGLGLVALVALTLATFALPVRVWRTGELPAPPLPILDGGPSVEMPGRIWIDTDAACGHERRTDPDDCLAILLLVRAAGPRVVGVSTVFGNAPLEVTDRVTRGLAATLAREGAARVAVHRGSSKPAGEPRAVAPAHVALRQALEQGPLTLVSLGPLTNVAAALAGRPDLQRRVGRLVAVMGRRSGHLFHPAEGEGHGILFGHGPVFSDFNFEQDREAAAAVLGMHLPTTLIPYEAGRDVTITARALDRLAVAGGAAAWVAERARGWLDFWRTEIGIDGFYPFDALAAAYAIAPRHFDCARATAWVARDDRLWGWFKHPWGLIVGLEPERPAEVESSGEVVYCPRANAALGDWMLGRLAGSRDGMSLTRRDVVQALGAGPRPARALLTHEADGGQAPDDIRAQAGRRDRVSPPHGCDRQHRGPERSAERVGRSLGRPQRDDVAGGLRVADRRR